jgi:DHA1 family purine base/nucleoside efflux pump-like MFS transporter
MGTKESQVDKSLRRQLLLPTLMFSTFLATCGLVLVSTLLPDVAQSFQVSIGTASQMNLIVSLVGLALGLAMGALTIRFNHKLLFLSGVAFLSVGVLGLFFSPNFAAALLVSVFSGLGSGIIAIMTFALIGELLPLEKRGMAMGLTISMVFLSFVVAAPLFGAISQAWGWRSVLIWFSFPLSLVCLILGLLVIPSNPRQEQPPPRSLYLEAFKQILFNKSAAACLVGIALLSFFNSVPTYAVTFYRMQFSVSPVVGGTFSSVAALGGLFGAVGGGALINRYGRKTLAVIGGFVAGIGAILFTLVPHMALSVALWVISASFAALTLASLNSLVLEQVPAYRASMMSVSSTFGHIGGIMGVAVGGLVLNLYANNFQILMPIFGASSVACAAILLLLARDPCKTAPPSQGPF